MYQLHACVYQLQKNNGKLKSAREILLINGYLFYCSTGRNSSYKGTWFPFKGGLEKQNGKHRKGWLIKANRSHSIKNFLEEEGIFVDEELQNTLKRFGTIYALTLSMHLKGGFWDTAQGKEIEKILKHYYPLECSICFHAEKDDVLNKPLIHHHSPTDLNNWAKLNYAYLNNESSRGVFSELSSSATFFTSYKVYTEKKKRTANMEPSPKTSPISKLSNMLRSIL